MDPIVKNAGSVFYTHEDVAKHKSIEDLWTILHGKVYDVTNFAKIHPGGEELLKGKGKDCTDLFEK